MGGRGASSGRSDKGKAYGTEYTTLYQSGNMKFIIHNGNENSVPLETMTKGRIYVNIDKNKMQPKSISFYDQENKRFKQIDLDHHHNIDGKPEMPHTQYGYHHNKEAYRLNAEEQKIVDKANAAWYNYKKKKP